MGEYVITIVPVVDDGFSAPVSQTMVRLDVDGDQPVVRELTMKVSEGSGLITGRHRYYVDFETLLRAFVPADGPVPVQPASPAPVARPAVERVPEAPAAPGRGRTPANRGRAAAPRRSSVAKNDHLESGRAYRKAPELPELEAVYLETGTIAGVAEHFDVPVHTAQGWITRMRRKKRSPANG